MIAAIAAKTAAHGLEPLGAFLATPQDRVPDGYRALVMLGPATNFWPHFSASAEAQDGQPDPLDRWSSRVIGGLARELGAEPLFPFGGPPYHPFLDWAKRTGTTWSSPVGLLVHDRKGLFVSFRGALAFSEDLGLSTPATEQPCNCLLYTSPSPRDQRGSRMPSSA